jgi:ABC-type dipeptide/oligopeptide/nickel transport system permease component
MLERLPASLELALASMIIALVVAVPIGIISAVYRGSALDMGSMLGALFGLSMPHFWLGIMLMMIFSVHLGWLPTSGRGTVAHLIMPSLALGLSLMAMFARLTRSLMLEVLSLDYIRTARAKGLREFVVVGKHALKNAMIPLVTVAGMQFGFLIGGPSSSRLFSPGPEWGVWWSRRSSTATTPWSRLPSLSWRLFLYL